MNTSAKTRDLPLGTRAEMLARLLAVQGSWNYELMLGTGLGFAIEPALRRLPGGKRGDAYRAAVARQSAYFNAHPYLVSIAAGALARAELDGEAHDKITRFRTALCGPLGSLGDRLVWTGWLPVCSLVALALFGLGADPVTVIAVFLALYNVGHLGLRVWGLSIGWTHGLGVARALGNPILRDGPTVLARFGAVLTGIAVPLALHRLVENEALLALATFAAALAGAVALILMKGRVHGWSLSLAVLSIYALFLVVT